MATDPIFAAIKAWRLARKRHHAEDLNPHEDEKLTRQYWTAARKMARTVPTTKAGAAALLAITTQSGMGRLVPVMPKHSSAVKTGDREMASDYQPYLTTREAEDYSGLKNLAKRRVQGTSPPFIKTGDGKNSRVLYARAQIDSWLEARTRKSTSEFSAMAGA